MEAGTSIANADVFMEIHRSTSIAIPAIFRSVLYKAALRRLTPDRGNPFAQSPSS